MFSGTSFTWKVNWDFVEIAAQKAQYGGHSMESRWTGGWGIPIDQYKLAMMIYQREMKKRKKRKKKKNFSSMIGTVSTRNFPRKFT